MARRRAIEQLQLIGTYRTSDTQQEYKLRGVGVLISWYPLCDLSESIAEEWLVALLGTRQADL